MLELRGFESGAGYVLRFSLNDDEDNLMMFSVAASSSSFTLLDSDLLKILIGISVVNFVRQWNLSDQVNNLNEF